MSGWDKIGCGTLPRGAHWPPPLPEPLGRPASHGPENDPHGSSAKKKPTPVDAIKHKDDRVNIPTHELRDFVRDEAAPCRFL